MPSRRFVDPPSLLLVPESDRTDWDWRMLRTTSSVEHDPGRAAEFIADEAAGPGARAQTPPIAVHRDQRDLPVWTRHVGMISTSAGARRSTRSTVVHKGPSGERLVA